MIKTKGSNIWADKKIPGILEDLKAQVGDGVILKFRGATRTPGANGLLMTGVLAGSVVADDARLGKPVLWVFDMNPDNERWNGVHFVYPTIVLPESISLTIFNKS